MSPVQTLLNFLISAHAVGFALAAVHPDAVPGMTIALAIAASTGHWIGPHLEENLTQFSPRKLIVALRCFHGLFIASVLTFLPFDPDPALRLGLGSLIPFQFGLLFCAGGSRGWVGGHANSAALIAVALIPGGKTAAAAILGYGPLLAVWLTVDQALRTGTRLRHALATAIPSAAILFFLLAALVLAAPPLPIAGSHAADTVRGPVSGPVRGPSTFQLLLLFSVVIGLAKAALYFWRASRSQEQTKAIAIPSEERAAEPPPVPRRLYTAEGWRGRVIRLYGNFLDKARAHGLRVRPDWTPREIATRLPAPAQALTTIYERARYGPDELDRTDHEAALKFARETLARLSLQERRKP